MGLVKKLLIGAAVVATIAIGDHMIRKDNSVISQISRSQKSLENILERENNTRFKDYVKQMKERGLKSGIENEGKVEQFKAGVLPRDMSEDTLIFAKDSPLLNSFYDQTNAAQAEFIKGNVEYIVFSPDITDKKGSMSQDVNGLSIGNGIILVDTKADNGGIKNPLTYISTMGHEAQHESERGDKLPTLVSERNAFVRGNQILNDQITKLDDEILKASLDNGTQSVETADYLLKFGEEFLGVYPNKTLLAGDLLEAKVDAEILSKYNNKKDFEVKTELDQELLFASYFAHIASTEKREVAIKKIHGIVTDKNYEGTIAQVSGASALQYLSPKSLKTKSDANVGRGNGAHLNFSNSSNNSNVGKGVGISDGYSVSGLPSLGELLGDERWENYQPDKKGLEEKTRAKTFEIANVDRAKVDNKGNIYFPDREGSPGEGFVMFYAVPIDKDGNGVDDGLRIYWGSRMYGTADSTMAKIDEFDGRGEYVKSGVINFRGVPSEGNGLNVSAKNLSKEWALEFKPQLYRKNN